MKKYTWTNDETFSALVDVAHYGPNDLPAQRVEWQIEARSAECGMRKGSSSRRIIAKGVMGPRDLPTGDLTEVDFFSVDLSKVKKPQKLTVSLRLPGTKYRNSYEIWVYPAMVQPKEPKKAIVTRSLNRKVIASLENGASVVLLAKPDRIKKSVAMAFQSGFWSPMFRKPGRVGPLGETPGTQGILCDPEHPLFNDFPTESHTNWQWWQLVKNSRAMILDDMPNGYRPTVQVIDGFDRNHKLGLLFEVKVGKGKLLVCSIDLPKLQEYPEGRQMLSSIYRYVAGNAFKPAHKLEISALKTLF